MASVIATSYYSPYADCNAALCYYTGLVLKIFLIILPPILALMARFEGKISVSQVDFSVGELIMVYDDDSPEA